MVGISAMSDYCDPDLMLITETKLDSSINSTNDNEEFFGIQKKIK